MSRRHLTCSAPTTCWGIKKHHLTSVVLDVSIQELSIISSWSNEGSPPDEFRLMVTQSQIVLLVGPDTTMAFLKKHIGAKQARLRATSHERLLTHLTFNVMQN